MRNAAAAVGTLVPDELEQLLEDAFPSCPQCGAALEPAGELERPYWACPACGATALSA